MTAATPEPGVDVVARVLGEHSWFDGSCLPVNGSIAHWYGPQAEHGEHVAPHLLAALRAAAGAPDVDALAEVARRAYVSTSIVYLPSWANLDEETKAGYRAIVRAVLDRLAITGGGGGAAQLGGHWCENCDGIAPGSCAFNPHREADDAVERAAFRDAHSDLLPAWAVHDALVRHGYGASIYRDEILRDARLLIAAAPVSVVTGDEAVELRAAHDLMATQFKIMQREKEAGWREADRREDEVARLREKLDEARAALRAGGDRG